MVHSLSLRMLAGLAAAGALVAVPAVAQDSRPDGHISFHGGSVAFVAGVSWGGGTLDFHGRHYPLKVRGLSVGDIGASGFSASGEVYHLRRISDINGTYAAAEAEATAGAGGGGITMRNDKGVVINARSTRQGLQLTLAPKGVEVRLK
ncbi:MAG TPA: EipA family protein [Caulobacteraceae bacterium]|nr:EipA family protein [Caulobacteraceae bacterium]